ncbi:DNA repair protein [Acinetobacter sp. RIT698]|jgi:phosphatidylserine/phosphatidylglycerophosphate/cardiolipin synthase-like enzyme|uniref:phospholipase D family protein n=1 Tax=Acinetobacter TaxID=469 RepID=UPI0012ACDA2C|nr:MULTISPECIES: phospholipase D family protein [unclassified Acinetobacter]MCG7222860.1 phospholipase D family protein [Acinetobacter sp. AG3]MCT9976887.1 phospholipase D family protein [Acinetobacter sp. I-MWF]MRT37326.1 DNA repair protein [Acinetobacter sp. RIT698]UOH18747.1 phospholipase D family protein [Acinetobacter sp. NyZ410]
MAKFLNTSGTNFFLEELIKNAKERLILISPYLRLNDRIKELLEDKNRLKIDIRIIYGKSDLHPDEIKWMQKLDYVRVSFCKNLHAKCYLNETSCIISSLNLYEFSQVNNNEMGILINKEDDTDVYKDAYEEAQRIIRISDEVRISLDEVKTEEVEDNSKELLENSSKLTSSKLAAKHKLKTPELLDKLVAKGFLTLNDGGKHYLTEQGKTVGGEFRSSQYGGYFLWNENTEI